MKNGILAIGLILSCISWVGAQTYTWTGNAMDSVFSNPANWDLLSVPDASSVVQLPQDVSIYFKEESQTIIINDLFFIADNLASSNSHVFNFPLIVRHQMSIANFGTNSSTITFNKPAVIANLGFNSCCTQTEITFNAGGVFNTSTFGELNIVGVNRPSIIANGTDPVIFAPHINIREAVE